MTSYAQQQVFDMRIAGDPLVADIYRPAHTTNDTPVLLIHGWGGSGRYWQPTVARLRNEHTMIVPDLPGVGRSLPVLRGRSMFDQAAAIEALLIRLGIRHVQVVGHSMGGGIGILLAARNPALVERLALVGVSLFRNDYERMFFGLITEMAGLFMRFRSVSLANVPLLAQQFATRFFHRIPADSELLREGFLDYLQMDYDTALASARSASSPEISTAASQIRCPTLVIAARQDQIMPVSNIDVTMAAIPNAKLHWIEECGHIPMVEKADEFAEVLQGFLNA
jgi:pimeloyl-ACP methyl ester carboxylesterase